MKDTLKEFFIEKDGFRQLLYFIVELLLIITTIVCWNDNTATPIITLAVALLTWIKTQHLEFLITKQNKE